MHSPCLIIILCCGVVTYYATRTLWGLYGLYGLWGLYGLYGLYGLWALYGLYGTVPDPAFRPFMLLNMIVLRALYSFRNRKTPSCPKRVSKIKTPHRVPKRVSKIKTETGPTPAGLYRNGQMEKEMCNVARNVQCEWKWLIHSYIYTLLVQRC